MARKRVVLARIIPITIIITPIISLASSFIFIAIWVIEEKQKAAKITKNASVFLLFTVDWRNSVKKGISLLLLYFFDWAFVIGASFNNVKDEPLSL